MTVSEALTKINQALRGIDDDVPTFGDEEAVFWLSVLNNKKDELFRDSTKLWSSAFNLTAPNEPGTVATTGTTTLTGTDTYFTDYQAGDTILVNGETSRTIDTITSDTSLTVTAAFDNTDTSLTFTHTSIITASDTTYSLHRRLVAISDQVKVTDTNSIKHYFDVIQPQARTDTTQEVFEAGENPRVLNFTNDIDSGDAIVGGTLAVPGYYLPADMTAATDILPFPDPMWGVMATAAEIAFSDIVYEDKAADINAKANALFRAMSSQNRAGTYNRPRRVKYNNYHIRQPKRY